jgi:hypothetical protein
VTRRALVALVVVLVVVAVVGAGAARFVTRGSRDRLARAADLLDEPDRFDTGLEAGETLARVAELLLEDARRCRADHGAAPRCQAMSSASAVAQVFAVEVLDCTAPGRFEARTRMAGYLAAVATLGDGPGAEVPQPPAPPRC